jgi:hypothetical protein
MEVFCVFGTTLLVGRGEPITFRAASFKALLARKTFFLLFFFAMLVCLKRID